MKKKVFNNKVFFETITDSLKEKESVSFIVKGHSMNPFFIDQETEVYIKEKDFYNKRDVCLFQKNNKFFLHRLIKIKGDLYYFRGDHLYRYEVVNKVQIFGYVYQFENHNDMIQSTQCIYRLKVNLYLFFKSIKMVLRKLYRGVFHGNK